MKTHELKVVPLYFKKIINGTKTAEIRFDDRGFEIGDYILLKEWKPRKKVYTGSGATLKITDITRLCYIIEGIDHRWVMLSFEELID